MNGRNKKQSKMKIKRKIKPETWLFILLVAVLTVLCLWAWRVGVFHDLDTLRGYVDRAGLWAPLVPIAMHLLQILVPFIPGGVVLTAVVISFGPWRGFFINYIGIVLGSTLAFALTRFFGRDFARARISPEHWRKYFRWLDNEKLFRRMFLLLILLPFAPDDALCMLAGLSKMPTPQFLLILCLAKIPVLLLYSLGMIGADALL